MIVLWVLISSILSVSGFTMLLSQQKRQAKPARRRFGFGNRENKKSPGVLSVDPKLLNRLSKIGRRPKKKWYEFWK